MSSKAKKEADALKDSLLTPKKPEEAIDWDNGLSSGCTMFNLACSGRTDVAWFPGHFYPLVGSSGSGKTWLLYQTLAEAARNERYGKHRLLINAPERGALMDVRTYFGKLSERLEMPDPSETHEQFYDQVDELIASGVPFIEGLDSEDALIPEADLLKVDEDAAARRKAADKGKTAEISGSYGMARAKVNSTRLRVAHNGLYKTGSILFMVKQTRDKIGFGSRPGEKTKSGGNAITFFATNEIWFSVRGDIRRSVRGKNRVVGTRMRVRVEKNRTTGRERTVDLIFYPDVGYDDNASMILFLVDEGHWEGKVDSTGEVVNVIADDFDYSGKLDGLVEKIESELKNEQLIRRLVKETWDDIEAKTKVVRRPRYQ